MVNPTYCIFHIVQQSRDGHSESRRTPFAQIKDTLTVFLRMIKLGKKMSEIFRGIFDFFTQRYYVR